MMYGCAGYQGHGKTLTGVILAHVAVWLWGRERHPLSYLQGGYWYCEGVVSNVAMPFLGDRLLLLNNEGLRRWFADCVRMEYRNWFVLIDEIDRVFPARLWKDPVQTEAILNAWQDEKLNLEIFYTTHFDGTDKIIRDATRAFVWPEMDKVGDMLHLDFSWSEYDCRRALWDVPNVSEWFENYDREQLVK